MDVASLNVFLLAGALVLVAAVLAVRVSVRFGLPTLVIYLLIGVALGEAGLGVQFNDPHVAQSLAYAALVVILAEGGLTTRWRDLRPSLGAGLSLATVGVGISTAIIAAAGHFIFGLDWVLALLLGAVFAPTDAAAVFSTLRRVPLTRRMSTILEAESGLNDAPTIVVVVLVSTGQVADYGVPLAGLMVLYQLVAGAAIGLALGWLGSIILHRVALPAPGLYPIMTMTITILAYATGAIAQASGFAAVYVAALVLGNSRLEHRAATRSFVEGMALLAQIGLFVMLGLLASPARMPEAFVAALVAGTALTFVARPIAVWVSTVAFRLRFTEQLFLSWAGLRGAIPVVLATIPLAQGVDGANWLFAVVFIVAVVFTLLQAPILPWLADRLGVSASVDTHDAELESAPLERIDADLIQVRIPPHSRLHGVTVSELRLPAETTVPLLVRGEQIAVPDDLTPLRSGDELLIVAPKGTREATERRLRAVGRGGRLAGWFGEHGR
ncbi:potassium/proton antiporter [Actinobacteria bacterium YIM 96077]|uniref:Potassium/proton antiporter n=1 Tax=Phytoactinopolyspora halophila TaxID=1981511 RepID=A0A329QCX3_9ACTN|nr:potassium/proton antiporter [Phytoactinopolyspora halophila]AYY11830.1 potassium/proton antiporter [Actinobacteria bacterium YIM 96077]RAW09851.1 potassium/proton antiporter [Phytoactinopolyspora halophila]